MHLEDSGLPEQQRGVSRGFACALALLIVAGVALRWTGLGHAILWHDEVYTRLFAGGFQAGDWRPVLYTGEILRLDEVQRFLQGHSERPLWATLGGLAHDEPQHPPLYYVLLRPWCRLFGTDLVAFRALSALFGTLCVPAAWWLAREAFGRGWGPWVAAAQVAISPFFVLYSQEAREYALLALLILLGNAAFLRALRLSRAGGPAWGAWALYSLLTTLSLYTSLTTLAVLLAQVLHVLLAERARAAQAAAAMAVAAALFAPWAWVFWQGREAVRASMGWVTAVVVPRSETLSTFAVHLTRPFLDLGPEPAMVAVVLGVAGIAWCLPRPYSEGRLLLLLVAAVPVGLLLLPDLLVGGLRSSAARYWTPTLVALVLLVSQAVARRPLLVASILLLGLAGTVANGQRTAPWTKGISMALPVVAAHVAASERPLVVGNLERHHPGNLLALTALLPPRTRLQFLAPGVPYRPPEGYDVFLFSPIGPFLEDLEQREGRSSRRLYEDVHMSLWRLN